MESKAKSSWPVSAFILGVFAVGTVDEQFFNIPGVDVVVGIVAWLWFLLLLIVQVALMFALGTIRYGTSANAIKWRETLIAAKDKGWAIVWGNRLRDIAMFSLMYFAGHPTLALLLAVGWVLFLISRAMVGNYVRENA